MHPTETSQIFTPSKAEWEYADFQLLSLIVCVKNW